MPDWACVSAQVIFSSSEHWQRGCESPDSCYGRRITGTLYLRTSQTAARRVAFSPWRSAHRLVPGAAGEGVARTLRLRSHTTESGVHSFCCIRSSASKGDKKKVSASSMRNHGVVTVKLHASLTNCTHSPPGRASEKDKDETAAYHSRVAHQPDVTHPTKPTGKRINKS